MMIFISWNAQVSTRQVHHDILRGGTRDGAHGCGPAKLSCGRLRCGKLFGSPAWSTEEGALKGAMAQLPNLVMSK